jgi:hypothetical protein
VPVGRDDLGGFARPIQRRDIQMLQPAQHEIHRGALRFVAALVVERRPGHAVVSYPGVLLGVGVTDEVKRIQHDGSALGAR